MIQPYSPDNRSICVRLLTHQVMPVVPSSAIYERLGIGGLYVMSEEWWDPSVIEMYPRMPVGFIPTLHDFRQQQLQRLRTFGVDIRSTWYRADEYQLLQALANAMSAGHAVGLLGIAKSTPLCVQSVDGTIIRCRNLMGHESLIDMQQLFAPAGIECVIASACSTTVWHPIDDIRWLVHQLIGLTTIAFDTPRHPLRDWQVWHIGADAFAVAAFSAETAAPLAIVSDNISRIIHAYLWRNDVLQQQLVRINMSLNSSAICDAIDACDDARFFMSFVAQYYPINVGRRALTIPEGALIAEACRDTRQVMRGIADLLSSVV